MTKTLINSNSYLCPIEDLTVGMYILSEFNIVEKIIAIKFNYPFKGYSTVYTKGDDRLDAACTNLCNNNLFIEVF